MKECSNCGASVRDGARFCTNCGVRLDSNEPASPPTATTPRATDTAAPSEHDTLAGAQTPGTAESEPPPEESSSTAPAETDEPVGTDAAMQTGEPMPSYEASWPEDETAQPESTEAPEATWPDTPPPAATDATISSDDDEGPSNWESWAPTPDTDSGLIDQAPTASANAPLAPSPLSDATSLGDRDDPTLQEIRDLVDTLQQRLTRIDAPVAVQQRGIDADELADELNGWTSGATTPDDLLEVIRNARENPRDIDAVTRLAERAGELESLIEHYGTIRTDAQRWVARLRNRDDFSAD